LHPKNTQVTSQREQETGITLHEKHVHFISLLNDDGFDKNNPLAGKHVHLHHLIMGHVYMLKTATRKQQYIKHQANR
jgi:hypothetical protein